MKPLIVLLILVSLALAASLYVRHDKAVKEKAVDTQTIEQLSNKVTTVTADLNEQIEVNTTLSTNLAKTTQTLLETSNTLASANSSLARIQQELKETKATAAADIAQRDARINELETQRDDLTKRMTDLNVQITGYESQISDINRKLAASEGDREFLLKELKRLQTEKTELERQFNDLAMLREQVRKLRDELSISRRLDWIRRGLYGQLKGAERLQRSFQEKLAREGAAGQTNYDLNVEIKRTGEATLQPATNAPAVNATNTPAPPQ